MKVLLINSVCGIGSTGRICTDLATEFEAQGHEVKIAYGREEVQDIDNESDWNLAEIKYQKFILGNK